MKTIKMMMDWVGWWLVSVCSSPPRSTLSHPSSDNRVDHDDRDDCDDDNVDYEDGWSSNLRICCLVLSFDYICIILTIGFCTLLLKPNHNESSL